MSDEAWERQKARIAIARDGEIRAFARFIGMEHNLHAAEWLFNLEKRISKLDGEET